MCDRVLECNDGAQVININIFIDFILYIANYFFAISKWSFAKPPSQRANLTTNKSSNTSPVEAFVPTLPYTQ